MRFIKNFNVNRNIVNIATNTNVKINLVYHNKKYLYTLTIMKWKQYYFFQTSDEDEYRQTSFVNTNNNKCKIMDLDCGCSPMLLANDSNLITNDNASTVQLFDENINETKLFYLDSFKWIDDSYDKFEILPFFRQEDCCIIYYYLLSLPPNNIIISDNNIIYTKHLKIDLTNKKIYWIYSDL